MSVGERSVGQMSIEKMVFDQKTRNLELMHLLKFYEKIAIANLSLQIIIEAILFDIQTHTHTHPPTHTHTHTHTHTYIHTHPHAQSHTHTHTHRYIYIYTHTYIYRHTYTDTLFKFMLVKLIHIG
jgi:hypothetical protein